MSIEAMDKVNKRKRSEIMSKIKSKNTKIENFLFKTLKAVGYKIQRNEDSLLGKPDIVIAAEKILIFVDSCFWHGCRYHCRLPNTNKLYWESKIKRNKLRDKFINKHYQSSEWKVIRFWEHSLKGPSKVLNKIKNT
jgi:DNA mismatch endonuclease (patch repair protein)